MGVIIIPNQPLNLLEINELGHNDRLKLCNCMGQKYNQLATCDDESSVQVGLTESDGIELLADDSFDAPIASGTTDGTTGNDIDDSGGDFIDDGVITDMIATNETDTTYSYVDALPTATVAPITALTGGFVTGEDYSIWRWRRKLGGSFGAWSATEYLNIDNGRLTKVGNLNDTAVFEEFNIQAGVYYKITFTIENMVRTTNVAGVKIFIGGTEAIFVNSEGTKTFYYFAELPTDNEIVIQGVDATWAMTSVSIKAMTKINIGAREVGETDFVFIETSNDNIKYRQIDLDDDGLSIENTPVANAKFEWSNVKSGYTCLEGCYELCILDLPAVELVTNGHFIGSGGWTIIVKVTNPWTIGAGVLIVDGPGNTTGNLNLLENALLQKLDGLQSGVGKKYTLTLTVSNWLSGGLLFNLPNNNTTGFIFDGSANANGTHAIELDLTNEAFDETKLRFFATGTDGPFGFSDFTVDDVSILINADQVNVLNCSEPFVLKSEHTCSMLLKWTNISNAFGINYDLFTLVHSLRVLAKKWQPNYEKVDKKTDTNSLGVISSIYSRTVKKERFTLRELPEYVHDALSIGLEHDSFTVDGTTFVTEDEEYAPEWRKSSLSAPVNVELIESGQLLEKRRCQ